MISDSEAVLRERNNFELCYIDLSDFEIFYSKTGYKLEIKNFQCEDETKPIISH